MKYYDVTLTISPELTVWPGDPGVELERVAKMEDGADFNASRLALSVHAGTHVDAPCHFLEDGASVEQLALKTLIGRVCVVDMTGVENVIDLAAVRSAHIPFRTRRVLFKTRNSDFWGKAGTGFREDFVGVDADAAAWLASRGMILVGVDYLSVAPWGNSRPTHEMLLRRGVVVVEGLDLSAVKPGRYMLYCLPLRLKGSDGAPARVILVGV